MTMQSDNTDALAETIAAVQGELATYLYKDSKHQTINSITIDDAVVSERVGQGYTDEDGRFFARAIDVQIRRALLPDGVRKADALTWDGGEWFIQEYQRSSSVFFILATRLVREELTGGLDRRERRVPGDRGGL